VEGWSLEFGVCCGLGRSSGRIEKKGKKERRKKEENQRKRAEETKRKGTEAELSSAATVSINIIRFTAKRGRKEQSGESDRERVIE